MTSSCVRPEGEGAAQDKREEQPPRAASSPAIIPPGVAARPDGTATSEGQEAERQPVTARPATEMAPPETTTAAVPPLPKATEMLELSGEELRRRITNAGGRATLVNAWASWCGPCRREFPMMVELKERLQRRGVDLVFVSVDEAESRGAATQFARESGEARPLLFARHPLGAFKRALNEDWPGMLPATFLYDGDGKLRHFWGGPVYEGELTPVIDDLLAGKLTDGASNFALIPGKDLREQAP